MDGLYILRACSHLILRIPLWWWWWFSRWVVSDSLKPHGLKYARLPCPPLSSRVCSNSCPLSWWCHPNHLIFCRPLLLLRSIFPSIRVFSNESPLCIRWPEDWSFSFSISPSNEYSRLISFKIDRLDLLAAQGTIKRILQHQSSSINSSAFRIIYSPTLTSIHDHRKCHSWPRWTIVGKVMSLMFNMLPRLVIAFLPRINCLLISWLHHHLQWF